MDVDNKILLIGVDMVKNRGTKLETQLYRKPTNTWWLLKFHGHTDKRYDQDSLLKTILHGAYAYPLQQRFLM